MIILWILIHDRLGIAYAASANEDIKELLLPTIEEGTLGMELLGHYALALGILFYFNSLCVILILISTYKILLLIDSQKNHDLTGSLQV